MKRYINIEDDHGDTHLVEWLPLETEGTTADVGRGFKWVCLFCLIWLLAAMGMVWFLFRAIWG